MVAFTSVLEASRSSMLPDEMDAFVMASLNTIDTVVLTATEPAPFAGVILLTCGGTRSATDVKDHT